MPPLFPDIASDEAFAAWRREPAGWLAAVREIAARHHLSSGICRPFATGSNLACLPLVPERQNINDVFERLEPIKSHVSGISEGNKQFTQSLMTANGTSDHGRAFQKRELPADRIRCTPGHARPRLLQKQAAPFHPGDGTGGTITCDNPAAFVPRRRPTHQAMFGLTAR